MSRVLKKSIESFISTLQTLIDFYSSSEFSSNVNNNRDSIEKIKNIISQYTDKEIMDITTSDLLNISLVDIKKILKLIDDNDDRVKSILESIKNDPDNLDILEEVKNILIRYITSYSSINSSQSEYEEDKVSLYRKYIELFSNPINEIFDDMEQLLKVMKDVDLESDKQAIIIKYLTEENSRLISTLPVNVSLMDKVDNIINKYLLDEDSEVYKTVYKYFKNQISQDPEEIAFKEDLDIIDVQNTVMVFKLSTLRDYYLNCSEEEKPEIEHELYETLKLEITEEYRIIREAQEYLNKYSDDYLACTSTGNDDFEHYVSVSISELETEFNSRELAYLLRKMYFIHLLDITLSTTFQVRDDEEKFALGCDNLHELIELIKDVENTQEIEKSTPSNILL